MFSPENTFFDDKLMTMLKPGARLRSAVCDAEVMVIKAPNDDSACSLTCGGQPMIPLTTTRAGALLAEPQDNCCLTGKRYIDDEEMVEVLCTKGGKGVLAIGAQTLIMKQNKALPSSD